MKKLLIASALLITVFLLLWLASIRFTNMGSSDFKKLEEALVEAQPYEDKLENEIIPQLNKALEIYPDDTRLIRHRLATFIHLGLLENAQRDAAKLIALTDNSADLTDNTTTRFIACGLAESVGRTTKEKSLECYRDVYKRYSDYAKVIDSFHVILALMGEMPEAEKIRADYLKNEQEEELRRFYTELFTPFKREIFLYHKRS